MSTRHAQTIPHRDNFWIEEETKRPPEPKISDYSIPQPSQPAEPKADAAAVAPGVIEKLTEKFTAKKPKAEAK